MLTPRFRIVLNYLFAAMICVAYSNSNGQNNDEWLDLFNGEDLSKATKETKLRKQEVSQEGFIVAAAIGEELGVRLQKLARAAVNLENVNVDFTKTIDNLLELHFSHILINQIYLLRV